MEELIKSAARRQHLLPDACGRHADREVHVFHQAVRREGDAEAAQHVPGLCQRRRFWCKPIDKRVEPGVASCASRRRAPLPVEA